MNKLFNVATGYYFVTALTAVVWPESWFFLAGLGTQVSHEAAICLRVASTPLLALGFASFLAGISPTSQWGLVAILFLANLFDGLMTTWEVYVGNFALSGGILFLLVAYGFALAFALTLRAIYLERIKPDAGTREQVTDALSLHPVGSTQNLAQLSDSQPLALVFIRHSGCTFCRETLEKLKSERTSIESRGVKLAIVGMSEPDVLVDLLATFGLSDLLAVSDPARRLYKALEIPRGKLLQSLGLRQIWYAITSGALKKYGVGTVDADVLQLSGSAVVYKRAVIAAHRAKTSSEACQIGGLVESARLQG